MVHVQSYRQATPPKPTVGQLGIFTYLQVLFPVEDDGLCFHLSIFDIHLVPTQNNGDVFTNPYQISVPIRYILVSDSGSYVEHNNCTLSLDIVAISEASELLLASCVPHIKSNGPSICVEDQRVHFHTQSGCKQNKEKTMTSQSHCRKEIIRYFLSVQRARQLGA